MVSKSVLGVVAALTFSGTALAQVPFFNVDIGNNIAFPAPAATFSGATTQAGTWNARSAAVASSALIDINGTLTAINANCAGANVNYEFNNTGTLAGSDDEKLMDDLQDLGGAPLGSSQWTIGPMPAGAYKVTMYSWAPDNRTYVTDIVLTGGANGTMQCGNSAGFTGYVLGQTHVTDTVQVPANGNIVFTLTASVGFGNLNGFQIEPGLPTATTYCTAKVNSLGCSPSIGSTGASSATSGVGFVIDTVQVINNKPGLYLYSDGGQVAVPFFGGLRCVGNPPANPIRRSVPMNSGGNPPPNDCTGIYSMDWNTFSVGGLGGTPQAYLTGVGNVVQVQAWGRDPGFPAGFNATLSDALEYIVGL